MSHHPPTLATHAEGRGWVMWQEFTMTTKFRGRYLQIIPMGELLYIIFCAGKTEIGLEKKENCTVINSKGKIHTVVARAAPRT